MLSLDDRLIIDIDSKDLCVNNIVNSFKSNIINYVNLGTRGYDNVWEIQRELHLLIKENGGYDDEE